MTFDQCIDIILKHEGGYNQIPLDPGGETNFGISKRAFPDLDIKKLTREDAIAIYKEVYWDNLKIDSLPETLRLIYFDCAINQGPKRASSIYEEAKKFASEDLIFRKFAKSRLDHYIGLPGWPKFGAGWARRLLDIVLISLF